VTAAIDNPRSSRAILVMGVSGSGKSTFGPALAQALAYRFIEGDDLHPTANVEKMQSGIPLNDEDRRPWLQRVADELRQAALAGGGVAACSALKRRYRDLIRGRARMPVTIFDLDLSREALHSRMEQRRGHFMPPSLLDSQLATLEPPAPEEGVIRINAALSTDDQVTAAMAALWVKE